MHAQLAARLICASCVQEITAQEIKTLMTEVDVNKDEMLTEDEVTANMELVCLMVGCDKWIELLHVFKKKNGDLEELDGDLVEQTHEEL